MLGCFPTGYHNLKEDDCSQSLLGDGDLASTAVDPRLPVSGGTATLRTFRKPNLPQSSSAPTSHRPKFTSSILHSSLFKVGTKGTKHLDRLETARKSTGTLPGSTVSKSDRYIHFPTNAQPRTIADWELSSKQCTVGSLVTSQHEMPRTRVSSSSSAASGDSSSRQAMAIPSASAGTSGASSSWNRNGSFVNKPTQGWLHPDQQLTDTGICYAARYVGCLEVNTSMKSLDFYTRSYIAKECINRVCEAAGLKTVDKKRKMDKRLVRMLADKPNMDYAGSNINLTITSSYLFLKVMESGQVIAKHEMPNISFASGGDADTLDFVAYVAKDQLFGRACFVLECGGGLAQAVITTIGQAFELRFKEVLKKTPGALNMVDRMEGILLNGNYLKAKADPDYYNDLPGKMPPDMPPLPPVPDYCTSNDMQSDTVYTVIKESPLPKPSSVQSFSTNMPSVEKSAMDNLIDLATELPPISHSKLEPDYVNNIVCSSAHQGSKAEEFSASKIPQKLSTSHEQNILSSVPTLLTSTKLLNQNATGLVDHKIELQKERWFHGPISRQESELLVVHDGDFLVRESQGSPGQYVLTGMQGGNRKHLLLVDPEGVVRTKDRMFESVSHLINYHWDNGLPIISAESALVLMNPIFKFRAL